MKKKHTLKIGCGMLILALCLWGCAAPTAQEETAAQETTTAQENSVAEFNRIMEGMENLSCYHVAYRFIMSGQGQTLGNQGWTEIWVDGEDYFYLNHKELPDIPAYDYGYLYLDGVTYGYNIVQNNEPCAGQTVFHFHLHLIPRYENDGIQIAYKPLELSDEQIEDMRKKLEMTF